MKIDLATLSLDELYLVHNNFAAAVRKRLCDVDMRRGGDPDKLKDEAQTLDALREAVSTEISHRYQ
jgi:hypothetical protein